MATTIESSSAGAANKKKHLGIPEAIFVVSGCKRVKLNPVWNA